MQFSSDKFIHLYTRRQKHKYTNTTHIIVYLKITAGESPQHKETSQLICHANKLISLRHEPSLKGNSATEPNIYHNHHMNEGTSH